MDDSFDSVESVIESVREGKVVILVDDLDRENEGDLMHTSGFVCVGMDGEILDSLEIPLMVKVDKNEDQFRTAFTQTVDYRFGTTTGISAHDRALTAIKLSDPSSQPEHFTRPGHLCPLRSRKGGLLTRRGHTEAGVDLCELAGLPKVSVICELVKPGCEEGSMSRRSDCLKFARDYDLRIVSINRIHKFILSKQ
ncbi:3,4-dihydroxy-2-butanone 4-phosphate synthase [Phakopsora pachyrhizi]|nr:3,4-dihydroxy-2-butanone 4-phosphate synthase [Phakopsora pachyrhizi]